MKCSSSDHKKIRRLLKSSPFDQNHHLINHKSNSDFKNHIIFLWTLNVHVELLKYERIIIEF
jgi:hypothetical protein